MLKQKLANAFGDFGILIYMLLSLFISIMPFAMIGAPFFVNIILIAVSQLVPFSTIAFWVWGLFCAFNGPQDLLSFMYYILFALVFVPFFAAYFLAFLEAKENDPDRKYRSAARRIVRSWGGNIRSMSITERLVLHYSLLLNSISEKSDFFSNTFVRSDALVVSCTYVAYILNITNAPKSLISDLETQVLCVLQDIFSMSPPVAKRLYEDRFAYFTSIIADNENDVTPMIDESVLLFAHDLHHNTYVPFTGISAVPIAGYEKQFMLNIETSSYFKQILHFTTETFESYFKS